MRAIVKHGNNVDTIENVGIVRHARCYNNNKEKFYDEVELWVNSMKPNTIVKLVNGTQVILEGD